MVRKLLLECEFLKRKLGKMRFVHSCLFLLSLQLCIVQWGEGGVTSFRVYSDPWALRGRRHLQGGKFSQRSGIFVPEQIIQDSTVEEDNNYKGSLDFGYGQIIHKHNATEEKLNVQPKKFRRTRVRKGNGTYLRNGVFKEKFKSGEVTLSAVRGVIDKESSKKATSKEKINFNSPEPLVDQSAWREESNRAELYKYLEDPQYERKTVLRLKDPNNNLNRQSVKTRQDQLLSFDSRRNESIGDLLQGESANPFINSSTPISSDLRNSLYFDQIPHLHPLLTSDSILGSVNNLPEDKTVSIEHQLSDAFGEVPIVPDLRRKRPPLLNDDSAISAESTALKIGSPVNVRTTMTMSTSVSSPQANHPNHNYDREPERDSWTTTINPITSTPSGKSTRRPSLTIITMRPKPLEESDEFITIPTMSVSTSTTTSTTSTTTQRPTRILLSRRPTPRLSGVRKTSTTEKPAKVPTSIADKINNIREENRLVLVTPTPTIKSKPTVTITRSRTTLPPIIEVTTQSSNSNSPEKVIEQVMKSANSTNPFLNFGASDSGVSGISDLLNTLNLFQQPQPQQPQQPQHPQQPTNPSLFGGTGSGSGEGGGLESLQLQLALLENLFKGVQFEEQGNPSNAQSHVAQQEPPVTQKGLSDADLKSIYSLIDNQTPGTTTTIPTTTTTTTTTTRPTTTTTRATTTTSTTTPQPIIPGGTTTLHPLLQNMLNVFTSNLQQSFPQMNNLNNQGSNPFQNFLVTQPPPPVASTTTVAASTENPSDLIAQLFNLGLTLENARNQNSVRAIPTQAPPPTQAPFDLASLLNPNNNWAFNNLVTTPRTQEVTPSESNLLFNIFGTTQRPNKPNGLYYWLDMNAFLGGNPTADPYSGIRPKIGQRDYFLRV